MEHRRVLKCKTSFYTLLIFFIPSFSLNDCLTRTTIKVLKTKKKHKNEKNTYETKNKNDKTFN